uniref:Putative secreted protein n=1 Tax=Anopheles triannulatus TaxID=58253 RepID=A0A2M4B6Q3_9DIPT
MRHRIRRTVACAVVMVRALARMVAAVPGNLASALENRIRIRWPPVYSNCASNPICSLFAAYATMHARSAATL